MLNHPYKRLTNGIDHTRLHVGRYCQQAGGYSNVGVVFKATLLHSCARQVNPSGLCGASFALVISSKNVKAHRVTSFGLHNPRGPRHITLLRTIALTVFVLEPTRGRRRKL